MRAAAIVLMLALAPIVAQAGTDCGTSAACDSQEHHDASDAKRSILVDATGTPYVAGAGVPVSGPVDQADAGSAAQAWYVRQAPGGANMSATNPLIVQLSDGSAVYAGPTSAQFPAALVSGRLSVDGSGVTQPISAAALPLPTGAATSARQAAPGTAGTPSSEVSSVQGVVGGVAVPVSGSVTVSGTATVTQGTAAAIGAPWPVQLSDGAAALGTAGNPVRVDPTGGTAQPVSGTVTVGTLPAGSISAGATGTAGTPSAAVVSVQGVASGTVLPVSDGGGSLTVDSAQLPAALGAGGGLRVDGSGTALPVSGTVALSGTSTVQGSGTAGTPAGGVLTVQGAPSMTALVVDGSAVTQPVSGTVTANIGTIAGVATETTLSTINGKLPSTVAADRTTAGAPAAVRLSDGTGFIGAAAAPVRTDPTGTTTQPVSDAGGSLTVDGTVGVSGTVTVDGSGVTQPVSGTVTANAGTGIFAISAASLPLPSGAATAAKQPALGTAGTASADVITMQGVAGMTPVVVSGTVTTTAEAGATAVGTSSTIACDTTAVVVDDTSVANTTARKVELCNPSTNSASIYATGSGGTGGREVLPGACYELLLAASSTPLYCYAASAVSAVALETR